MTYLFSTQYIAENTIRSYGRASVRPDRRVDVKRVLIIGAVVGSRLGATGQACGCKAGSDYTGQS